jgi:hypothetical protein
VGFYGTNHTIDLTILENELVIEAEFTVLFFMSLIAPAEIARLE